ncbi:MAG: nitric oxide reductase NorQ protein [Myxococcota bacterium]|jgi:nitric oxide reductase NorQ protein
MRKLTPPIEDFLITDDPFYLPVGDEVELFTHAWQARIPVILKGPTGCGKTRFVSHMARKLNRPLVTVACHEDLTASDLIGRYLIQGDETLWVDGPMTAAVRHGAILYLDEIVEARKDTMVVIHPLTDHRRALTIDKLASVLRAPPEFMLVISYNPGYQSILKEIKQSTRQRFVSLDFTYPPAEIERSVLRTEANVDDATARLLVKIAEKIRNLTSRGLEEGVSTRLLIHAARLIKQGSSPLSACEAAFCRTLTDDPDLQASIREVVNDYF